MKVIDLKEVIENLDDDVEVRLMIQPNYPLEYRVEGITTDMDIANAEADRDCEATGIAPRSHPAADDPKVVYLLEGTQIGYGKKIAWEAY
jgi:hypothetical protein